jgi:hypothetical protein
MIPRALALGGSLMRPWLILSLLVSLQAASAQEANSQGEAPPALELAPPLVKAPAEPEQPSLVMDLSPRYSLELEQGERVRVGTTKGELQSGEVISLMPGTLSLQASPGQVLNFLPTDVQRLETRERSPGRGALIGGSSGVVLGGLSFAFLCLAFSEGDGGDAGGCALAGGAVVGALGAGFGALLGLALPHWSTVYDKSEHGELALSVKQPEEGGLTHAFSGKGLVGELGLQLGYGRVVDTAFPTEGVGSRLHLLAQLGPHFAIGPEVAWYSHLGSETTVEPFGVIHENHSLFQLGGLMRGGVEIGPTRTALLLGLGLHDNRTTHLGGSVGGEVELDLGEGLPPLALDVRYHLPLTSTESSAVEKFLTFGVGSRLRW